MNGSRFTVQRFRAARKGHGHILGWAVFDGDRRITILFADEDVALQHRDNIARIYERFGW